MFILVFGYGNDDPVKDSASPLEHIEVAMGDGIEGSRVDANVHKPFRRKATELGFATKCFQQGNSLPEGFTLTARDI